MKKTFLILLTIGVAGLLASAVAQNVPGDNNPPQPPPDSAGPPPGGQAGPGENGGPGAPGGPEAGAAPEEMNGSNDVNAAEEPAANGEAGVPPQHGIIPPVVITPGPSKVPPPVAAPSRFLPPAEPVGTNNPDALRMNFSNAPLDMVLNYLSDAAGFIIIMDTKVNGNVNVISGHPMTRDEAVNLLNEVLNKNGYAAIRNGRTLTIVDKNEAKTRDIPVKTGNDPAQVPNNAEIVTQIIPVRFVEARQLVSDLTSFVSPQATVVANEAANSIVVTDTQANIRHLMEIIRAVDNSAEAETEIRVFRLKYANPTDVATELGNIFPSSTSGSGTQAPIRFGGRGGFFQRMMASQNNNNSSDDRIKKATQVTAVADARIQAVIVTAPKDLMEQIAAMMTDLDVPSTRDQKVYVFHMDNGDPQQAVQVLQNMFQGSGSTRGTGGTSSSQNSALMQRAQNNITTSGSSSAGSTSGFGTTGARRTGGGPQF
jgi:general secretion pathway protein D